MEVSNRDSAVDAYRRERRELGRQHTLLACLFAMVLIPLFAISDFFLYPADFPVMLTVRIVCVIATGALFLVTQTDVGRRHPDATVLLLGTEIGLALCAVPVYLFGFDSTYYSAAIIEIAALAILLLWAAWQAAVLSVELVLFYLTAAVLHGSIDDLTVFIGQASAIAAAGGLAVISMVVQERVRFREFRARRGLEEASKEKSTLIEDLELQTSKLQQLNQDMEDLLYVSSHDLRAPLINVQGFSREVQTSLSELSALMPETPEAKAIRDDIEESMRFIFSAIGRMDALIQALLGVSRISTRTNPTETVALQPAVQQIVESFRYQLDNGAISVQVGSLPTVTGDPVRLNQVFSNLIDNAIKYMGDSPRREIEIGTSNGDGKVRFFVRDSGPGIPARDQETVFRLFRRLADGVPGEGLGLSMVRKIVEKHGGRIWVESMPGDGTTFWFTLDVGDTARAGSFRGEMRPREEVADAN